MRMLRLLWTALFSAIGLFGYAQTTSDHAAASQTPQTSLGDYVVLGWNDLGMHCMNKNYSVFCILPPFNDLWAQVIHRGNPPQITTEGLTLEYSFVDNSYSVGKINFWSYAHALFGTTLPDNVGLTGKAMTGTLDLNGSAFEARGTPLTPYNDSTPTTLQAYQFAQVNLVLTATSATLDTTQFVAPTSTEMHCDLCHGRSGNFEQNILSLHDSEHGTNLSGTEPVLCGSCHSDNALGTPGVAGVPSLSRAIHGFHAEEVPTITCYNCHPGAQTQCLRGAMFLAGKTCTDCHGSISQVASSIGAGRVPWVNEPRCGSCHDANHAENPGTLYRNSTGHGGLYCTVCHNSPHAELPTSQPRDAVQALRVQGSATFIRDCMVCHTTFPTAPGPHGYFPPSKVSGWKKF